MPGTLFDMSQITVVVSRVTLLVCKISSPVTAMCSHRYVEATVCVCVAIIMTLTFELAMQIGRECRKFSKALELHVVCLCLCLYVCLCVFMSVCMSVCYCMSVCLSVSV